MIWLTAYLILGTILLDSLTERDYFGGRPGILQGALFVATYPVYMMVKK